MIKYVKINENGNLDYAPLNFEGVSNWGLSEELVTEAGYLPLQETDKPDDEKRYIKSYTEQNGMIVSIWTEHPYTKAEIAQKRAEAYVAFTDKLAAEYTRKSILGILSDEEKADLEERIRIRSEQIVKDNPYPAEESEAQDDNN